ncbi:DNA recombination protein RmuC [TM7 phylum sp. oral taxon 351]|nr:DNA recombination protein RmuC [TM7 phylum sp. oral taxon 351]
MLKSNHYYHFGGFTFMDQNILAILGIAILILLVVILFITIKNRTNNTQSDLLKLLEAMTKNTDQIVEASKNLHERMIRVETTVDKITKGVDDGFRDNRKEIATNLQTIQKTVDSRVKDLQTDNAKKLEEMRLTVDEKLQASVEKRFNESFKTISEQLTSVYKGLGEMKNLATGVGDLKKVMEGVKTRGIYGEVQLNSIISDILSPNQYQENINTKPGSADRVEFAVKMPGREEDHETYLPIDSKFPVENYSRLIAAYDQGNKADIITFQKALATDVKEQAKKISTKYIEPPFTTDFGMMFVPTESLYAEILRIPGLSDEIRQKYNISITSPSTLPVTLSGLLMGFRTVAIEKRSSEVWQVLGAIKTQFNKFGDLLEATKKKLQESANKIDAAATTSRQIERRLKEVESLPTADSIKLIGEIDDSF